MSGENNIPAIAVTALAGEIIAALKSDERQGGYDLESGLFGPAFSSLVRRWANAEYRTPASSPAQSIWDVWAERERQITVEGYTAAGDARYMFGELAEAGGCYALHAYDSQPSVPAHLRKSGPPAWWPWSRSVWKPRAPRRNLVRAAALIIAEIDAFDAKEAKK